MGVQDGMRQIGVTVAAVICATFAIASCSAGGVVTGRLVRVGGPAPGSPVPFPGTIEARDTAGQRFTVTAGNDGRFRLRLPPGTYRLTGRSPLMGSGTMICSAGRPLHLTGTSQSISVEVVCSIP